MYLQKLRLDGRTAFVTGGAGGIGSATAERMLAEGACDTATAAERAELGLPAAERLTY